MHPESLLTKQMRPTANPELLQPGDAISLTQGMTCTRRTAE